MHIKINIKLSRIIYKDLSQKFCPTKTMHIEPIDDLDC